MLPDDVINTRKLTMYLEQLRQQVKSDVFQSVYPVGSLYFSGSEDDSPANKLGFGTWARIEGKFIVGVSDTDGDFDVNDTGGHKLLQQHTHVQNAHYHSVGLTTNDDGTQDIGLSQQSSGSWGGWRMDVTSTSGTNLRGFVASNKVATNQNAGGGDGQNLPPYKAKYMWERTA